MIAVHHMEIGAASYELVDPAGSTTHGAVDTSPAVVDDSVYVGNVNSRV